MRKNIFRWTRGAALAAALAGTLAGGRAEETPKAGPERLPVFSLPDLDGKVWSSAQFAGRAVVVDFWATWCSTCRETIPKLAELSGRYKDKGLTVVGISEDQGAAEKVAKAAKKMGINYLVLHDKDNTLGDKFGFSGLPSLYVFDRRGRMRAALTGYDPDQEKQLDEAAAKAVN